MGTIVHVDTSSFSISKGTFYLYTGIACLGFVLFAWILPETKGKTLEDMQQIFERPWTDRVPTLGNWRKEKKRRAPSEKTELRTDFT